MRITLGFRWASAALALSALAGPTTALATTTEFNFDSIALTGTALSSGQGGTANSASIQGFMNTQLSTGTVAVAGAIANNGYTGDTAVNMVTNSSSPPGGTIYGTLAHLADSNDTGYTKGNFYSALNHVFLMNDNFGGLSAPGAAKTTSFTMTFTGIQIQSIAFDWEIFPNASCANNACLPTLTLSTNSGYSKIFTAPTDTTVPKNPQDISNGDLFTATFANATVLTFADWPAEIGIRGIGVTWVCTPGTPKCNGNNKVPEPGSLALVGVALAGAGLTLRRRKLNS